MSIDWQQVWQRDYINKPDERWKIRSLNADNAQNYNIKLPGIPPPSPKINKVNATMFCITIDTDINLFYQQTEERRKKSNKVFSKSTKAISQKIELVTGLTNEQGQNYLVIGTKDKIILIKIVSDNNGGYLMEELQGGVKNIPEFRSLVCFGTNRILAISAGQLHEFQVVNDALKELVVKNIEFKNSQDQKAFKQLKPIGIVLGAGQNFYYFGSRVEEQVDETKLKAGNEKLTPSECQALTIVQLHVDIGIDIQDVKGTLFPIDHIFELNLFTRTKIYEIQKETFLVSLHQEIILIKKHFGKFIVWDNVSVVSSRNQTMKGQLSLTSQTIMVFSQNGQISAHQIFFDSEDKKLSMPPIDRYRGHEIDQVLYDSLMLDTTDSIMKVLVYVKPGEVVYPGVFRGGQSQGKKKEISTTLDFAIQCINQNEPLKKLEQMIVKEKPNKEIQQFCDRYNITEQQLLKSKWNVSNKELKQIETILMGIKDDPFIQNELDSILKKDSHNLEFLNNVELKQGNRLKLLLAQKIAEYTRLGDQKSKSALKKYIFDVLQWIMESDMFLKKIKYSKNFLVFKQYDFIQIGKLRAASLKEEIKLLSCKSFEKRLKYFLNEFKTLVISNFDEVFEFLLMDKSVKEIESFIQSFNFILPNFNEPSQVFIMRKNYNIMKSPDQKKDEKKTANEKKKRERFLSFNPIGAQNDEILGVVNKHNKNQAAKQSIYREKSKAVLDEMHEGGAEKCILWEDLKEGEEIQQTIEAFIDKHINQLKGVHFQNEGQLEKAEQNLREIIDEFCQRKWFKSAAFKQHCMITKTSQEIYNQFKQLKRKKAFKILIKFLFKQVQKIQEEDNRLSTKVNKRTEAAAYQEQVDQMIQKFIADGLIPESFKRNVDARVRVYRQLLIPLSKRKPDKKTIAIELPYLSEFVVKTEQQYFQEIFYHIRDKILTDVKNIYDDIEPGFFRERFQLFLKSKQVTAQQIISFLDEFNQNVQADDIRIEVFSAIKRLLTLTDETNTRPYIQKSLEKEVLPQREDSQNKLREQAKIPIGFYFVDLFKKFNLNYTYEELIGFTNQTNIQGNKIIHQLIHKYCRDQYEMHQNYEGNKKVSLISFEEVGVNDKLMDTDICGEPLQFFGLLLIFLDMLDFYTEESEVFDLMMDNYLNVGKFTQLSQFILKLKNYHVTEFNMSTKNYQMISDFKEWIDIDGSFIDYTLEWIKKNYDSINNIDELEQKIQLNDRAINMLEQFNKNSPNIRKQRALFSILIHLMKFQPSIVLKVQQIKSEALANSSFLFMMHMFKKIGIEKFRLISAFDETEKVEYLFRIFESHQEHIFSQKVDYLHHQFIRFLIEVCIRMIECNYYPMAKYLILFKIPNDNEYFKDVLLLFLAAADRSQRIPSYSTDIVKMILTPETTSLIRNNLEVIIDKHKISGFIPVKIEQSQIVTTEKSNLRVDRSSQMKIAESKLIEERPEEKLDFYNSVCDVFKLTLSRHWTYDAFFFLVRAKIVRNDSLRNAAKGYFTSYSGGYDEQMLNIRFHACFLITSYSKALEQFIQKQFYPTFAFFSGKVQLLEDIKERKDVVKDINIALSKLEKMLVKFDKNRKLFDCKNQLEGYYEAFMAAVGQDADIHLVQPDAKGNTAMLRTQLFTRTKAQELEDDNMEKEITQKKKQIQTNINRTHEVQEDSRVNVLNRQVNEYITQIKKGNERHALLQAEIKRQPEQISLAERKAKELEEIKRKEKEDIESIKDTYKSNTTKRVNDLIENLRKRRQQIKSKTYAPTSAVRSSMAKSMAQSKVAPVPGPNVAVNILPARRAEQQNPTTMRAKLQERLETVRKAGESKGQQSKFLDLQKKLFPEPPTQSGIFNRKVNFQDVLNLYKEKQSAEALQCIQKYDMLKNAPVRSQLVKRAYSVTKYMDCFLRFIKFLIESDPTWKESVEEKSIPIATQMLKMQPKEKVTIKQIIPVELFIKVIRVSTKDYYPYAFDMFKPNLRRIFQKQLMPVHGVGILFRYSLGSENKYYNKVFYQYFLAIFKDYEMRNYDEKQLTLLAQKIRSNYTSLPDSKDHALEQLLAKISNQSKKRRLLETLQKIIERKGQSLVGGQANKQISYVVGKLLKS